MCIHGPQIPYLVGIVYMPWEKARDSYDAILVLAHRARICVPQNESLY